MKRRILWAVLLATIVGSLALLTIARPQSMIDRAVPPGFGRRSAEDDKNGPLRGYVDLPERYQTGVSEVAKTDYWAAIAISPSTGKYAYSCECTSFDVADRASREKCNAPDARAVVVCGNGWCALALGDDKPGRDFGWGVGWAPGQKAAETYALEGAREKKLHNPRVVYSVFARDPQTGGAIAFSESTGRWGYSTGGGRRAPYMALQNCKEPDAKIIAMKPDCWLALATGDDKGAYGWGYAGNRLDAERNALEACRQQTKNAKIVLCFPANGVAY